MNRPGTAPAADRVTIALRLVVVVACGILAGFVRWTQAVGVRVDLASTGELAVPAEAGWAATDPDTLYHCRRVARGVEDGGWIAAHDPLLAHADPDDSLGAPIPWPPTYDLLLTALVRGALPDLERLTSPATGPPLGPLERRRIEHFVATVPLVCGTLAAMLAALISSGFVARAGRAAVLTSAALAGITVALTFGHVRYSHIGNGDHHAFVSLLHLAMLGILARGLRPERLDQPVWSAARGALAGLLAAVLVTSWTPSILWLALVQLVLFVRLFRGERGADGRAFRARGLPLFATSFHKAALLGLVPAVLHSPFTYIDPWSLVELSWFHLALAGVGWLVFAPYALVPRLVRGHRLAALVPALGIVVLIVLATPVGARLGTALSWAGATNVFMGSITESQPLLGREAWTALVEYASYGALLAPLVVLALLASSRRQATFLPFALTLPVACVLAVLQRRFVESWTPIFAVSLGVVAASAIARVGDARVRAGLSALAVLLALAAHPAQIANTRAFAARNQELGRFASASPAMQHQEVLASLLVDLGSAGAGSPSGAPPVRPPGAVLAQWDLGHAIEWRAGHPTIATNFGLYVGEAFFLAPWRFLAESDPVAAERQLVELGARYVLMDGDRNRPAMARALELPLEDPAFWRHTMGARLLRDGAGEAADAAPDFLRLVDMRELPNGERLRLYERVEGARLRVPAARSLSAVASIEVAAREVWRASAESSDPGPLELRVPYAMGPEPLGAAPEALRATGTPRVRVTLRVFVDGREVPFFIREDDVQLGRVVLPND